MALAPGRLVLCDYWGGASHHPQAHGGGARGSKRLRGGHPRLRPVRGRVGGLQSRLRGLQGASSRWHSASRCTAGRCLRHACPHPHPGGA
eukprot:2059462-Alexandrium_andersonii.AAC.1